jgi:pimeloyl-ACP methyl ester carboxylesterase
MTLQFGLLAERVAQEPRTMQPDTHANAELRHRQVAVEDVSIHVVEAGDPALDSILCLHGWPQSWASFEGIMQRLSAFAHVVAIDLPGVGASEGSPAANDKRTLARYVASTITALGLRKVTLVGHDAGGQIVYAFLREHPQHIERAVIMNVAVPGVDPWSDVVRTPGLWHFAFHAVPKLPELMIAGHQTEYFAFFYDALAGPVGISATQRQTYVQAYARASALHTGLEWYRAFAQDERDNRAVHGQAVHMPVLYVRGDKERGDMATYVQGLRASGLRDVREARIPNSGHFAPDEQPAACAAALRAFVESTARGSAAAQSAG